MPPVIYVSSRPPSLLHNLNEVVVILNTLRNLSIYYGCLLPSTVMDSLNPSMTWVCENYAMDVKILLDPCEGAYSPTWPNRLIPNIIHQTLSCRGAVFLRPCCCGAAGVDN